MKLDTLVLKRFDELSVKAATILAAKTHDFSSDGKAYFRVSSSDAKGWSASALNLLQRAFSESSTHFKMLQEHVDKFQTWDTSFDELVAILASAREDYEGGYLFNLKSLVKAEVLNDALEQAKVLLHSGYKDPACVLVGISLEVAVKEIAQRNLVPTAKLDKMNVELAKLGVYNIAKQKQVTAWADLRNKAAHGDWSAYNQADVEDLLAGVERFIADHL